VISTCQSTYIIDRNGIFYLLIHITKLPPQYHYYWSNSTVLWYFLLIGKIWRTGSNHILPDMS
jgi:hypothetical protein